VRGAESCKGRREQIATAIECLNLVELREGVDNNKEALLATFVART
jgi:hypothetical protein